MAKSAHKKSTLHFFLIKLIVIFATLAEIAVLWDSWWHLAIGRDSPFIPPHLLIYTMTALAILVGLIGIFKIGGPFWKKTSVLLIILVLSALVDAIWHQIFGSEDFSTHFVVWSFPHLLAILSVMVLLIFSAWELRKESNLINQRFFCGIALGSFLAFTIMLLGPLYPFGPYRILGLWGAGFIAFFIVGILLLAHKWLKGPGGAMDTMIYALVIMLFGPLFGGKTDRMINLPMYPIIPNWILAFSFLIPAFVIDFLPKISLWLKAALAGVLWAVVLYGFSYQYVSGLSRFIFGEIWLVLLISLLGGGLAGIVFILPPLQRLNR